MGSALARSPSLVLLRRDVTRMWNPKEFTVKGCECGGEQMLRFSDPSLKWWHTLQEMQGPSSSQRTRTQKEPLGTPKLAVVQTGLFCLPRDASSDLV